MKTLVESFYHALGYGLCHQLPERSFFGGGYQLPVCARDTGIYVGFLVSFLVISVLERKRRRTDFPPVWLLAVGGVLFALMAIDGLTSYAGLRPTTNALRLLTGLGVGWSLSMIVVPMINSSLWAEPGWGRVLGDRLEWLWWLLALPVTFAVSYWGLPLLGPVYPLLVTVAILFTFSAVNLIIVSMFPVWERRIVHLREAWPALLVSLGLGVLEIVASAWLRVLLQSLARLG